MGAQRVKLMPLGSQEYGAEVHEGANTTYHRVLVSQLLLDDLQLPDVEEQRVADESLRFLLDRLPSTSLPQEIDLERLHRVDLNFLAEVRDRLIGLGEQRDSDHRR